MKAKYFPILLMSTLLVGCTVEPTVDDVVSVSDDDDVVVDADAMPIGSETGGAASPCSVYAVHDQVIIDGETIMFEVPVMCNPYVFDEGDPAPDLMQEVMTKQSQVQH